MNGKLALFCAAAVGFGALLAAGCQTYDFEPVEPLAVAQTTQTKTVIARQSKPDLMLLVDKSGSMLFPINPQDANCPAGCGPTSPCPGTCKTRISELRSAMNTFLTQNGTVARFGLSQYPTDGLCGNTQPNPASLVVGLSQSNDVDSELQAKANEVKTAINSLAPTGGTPTGASLRFVGNDPTLSNPDREDFVVLLTDGLPNCNAANPNNCQCRLAESACP
jgi:hypothetical protein